MFNQNSISSNQNTSNSQRGHNDRIKDALWNAFLISNDNVSIFQIDIVIFIRIYFLYNYTKHKSKDISWLLKNKIAIIVDVNTSMRNGHTDGIACLNPIDTSACIMIQLYYMMENKSNLDIFAVTDKLNKMNVIDSQNPQAQPDLNLIESLFQGVYN